MAKKETSRAAAPKAKAQDKIKKVADKKQKVAEPVTVAAAAENDDEWEDEVSEMQIDQKTNNRKSRRMEKQKPKTVKAPVAADSEDESDDEDDTSFAVDLQGLDDTDSDSEIGDSDDDEDDDEDNEEEDLAEEENDDDEDDSEEEDLDLEDLELSDDEDGENIAASARVRETINNKEGLLAALKRFALDTSQKVPFAYHQSLVSSKITEESIPDVEDDIVRELAFMNQALEAARIARKLLLKEKVPFTRPNDYFAETLRSDEIMDKVKVKLIEEATSKKASAEARKQRELKKFGKQVQIAKQQERFKEKRETLDKINMLKRKRSENGGATGATEEDIFDVAVENELKAPGANKKRIAAGGDRNAKRQKKDSKFGHGGKKRHAKSGDAASSGDLSGFSAKRMKTGGKPGGKPSGSKPGDARGPKPIKTRLGKGRRKAQAGKR